MAVLLVVGIGGYIIFTKQNSPSVSQNTQTPTPSPTPQQTQETTPQPSPTPAKKIEGWKTYRNEEYNFEIQYPSDWSIDDRVYPGKRIISLPGFHYSTDKEAAYPVPGDVNLLLSIWNIPEDTRLQTGIEQNLAFAQWFDTLHRQKESPPPGPEDDIAIGKVSVERITVDGREAYLQTYEYTRVNEGAAPIVKEVVVNIDGENVFILSASSPLPDGRKLIKVFDKILSTFNFIKD